VVIVILLLQGKKFTNAVARDESALIPQAQITAARLD
jgi:hypothetical protein